MDKVFSCVDAATTAYKRFLQDIVCVNSYSSDKASVDKVGEIIRLFAKKEGYHVRTVPFEKAGNGLLITCNENATLPPVILTGHIDTVFPQGTFREPLFREEGDKYFGPGVSDMKGGLAVGLLAMYALMDTGYQERPIRFIMIGDEELSEGLSGEAGKAFIQDNARGGAAAITLEPSDGEHVTVGRKGSIRYKVFVKGYATHAGSKYAEGISAIKEAAHKILDIEAPSNQAEITYNCGMISGGTAPNTVPGEATFTLYNRYWRMEQRQQIRDHVEGIIARSYIPGTASTFEVTGERLPMDATKENYALAAHIDTVSQRYGFGPLVPYKKASGSDASYTAMAGVPSVCSMGVIGGRCHSPEEYMMAASLPQQAKLLAAVIRELPRGFGQRI